MSYLRLSGVNILPFVKEKGIQWSENDLDGPNTGRTLDGTMHRDKVAEKRKVTLDFLTLKVNDANIVFSAIHHDTFVLETDLDPRVGTTSFTVYCSTRPATCLHIDEDGVAWWTDIKFSVIEL